MNANDVIESYVTDVALQLPRRQRNDVALELRELLTEELHARAEAAGRGVDADLAVEMLRSHGRPADVAARYRPALTVIDPADGHAFVRAAWVGLVTIWIAGLVSVLRQPGDAPSGLLGAIGQWWVKVVVPSVWWPGLLVTGYGAAAWARRRWPQLAEWKPRPADHISGGRAAMAMALAGVLAGLFVLLDPRWLLDVFFGGRAAPAAYEALTYTESFRQRQGPGLLALVALNVPLFVSAIATGRRPATMRRVELELGLITCAMLAWTILDGPVLVAPHADRTAKSLIAFVGAISLASFALEARRVVRPAPNRPGSPS